MAVTQREFATPSDEYTGLSSDTKPTEDVEPGAMFYESDTAQWWSYDGLSWSRIGREELILRLLWSINRNQERILAALSDQGAE